ncbi:alpha/beta fold hydrolase [Paenibacillus crassostreae]|nr:alpha/beta hydrolase [Paenibacillus crassostreae]AOZ94830.1 alpha/beta hydrolase [Paenibacillus crassostreae]
MIRKTMLTMLAIVIVMAGVGSVYQWVGSSKDKKLYQPVGKLYDVTDHKMHLYSGGQGATTIVFASGWGTVNPYADFYSLYERLEPHAKVAVYDRFGYGFSDTTGRKRDIDTITDEIHELLHVSGQKPPYIFVGHSLGSLETIRYAQRFPDEVKAILLVDGGSPEYYESSVVLTFFPLISRVLRTTGAMRALYHVDGFAEWMNDGNNEDLQLPEELQELIRKGTLLKIGNRDMTDEMRRSKKNAGVVLNGQKPLDIPITVLTADYFGKLSEDKRWMDSEAKLPNWSVSGKQIIVPDSSHYIHNYQPDLIVQELIELVKRK